MFYTGNWKTAKDENEKHLNGVVYVDRRQFMAVNGYNERLRSYGWDDTDLYDRLGKKIHQRDIVRGTATHIPHPDSIRGTDIQFELHKNMHLSKLKPWVVSDNMAKFQPVMAAKDPRSEKQKGVQSFIFHILNIQDNEPAADLKEMAELLSMRTCLNKLGWTWT